MGSGKGGKAPKAPDYASLAKQDAEQQRITAEQLTKSNRPNQTDQYGNTLTWSQGPGGEWNQSVNLSPDQKARQDQNLWFRDIAASGYGNALKGVTSQGSFQAPDTLGYSDFGGAYKPGGGGGGGGVSGPNMDLKFDPLSKFKNGAGEIGNFDRSQGDRVASDMYESVMSRNRPEQARVQEALDVKLRQQGLQPGTEAFDRAMKNALTSFGDVNSKAALDATGAGYQAAGDIYNTNLAGQGQRYDQELGVWEAEAQRQKQLADQKLGVGALQSQNYATSSAASTARANAAAQERSAYNQFLLGKAQQTQSEQQQRYGQALTNYNQPAQRASLLAGFMGGNPEPNFAGFSGATGYNPASMSNAAQSGFEAGMGKYSSDQGKKGNTLNAGASVAGAALMSDQRLKDHIEPLIGRDALIALMHLGGYEYDWKDGSGHDMGVIAQEVAEVLPNLVERVESGHLAVRYQGLVALAIESIKFLAGELQHG